MTKILSLLLLALTSTVAYAADPSHVKEKAEACSECHGAQGISNNPLFPSLAGQPSLFIVYQLIQFRGKQRTSAIMNAMAAPLSDDDMRELGAYFSALPPPPVVTGLDAAKIKRGQEISATGHCQSCHMPDLRGQQQVPRLAGQHVEYLKAGLKGLRDGTRKDIDGSMASAAQGLSDADIEAVSMFAASMGGTTATAPKAK